MSGAGSIAVVLVAAVAENGVIGSGNRLPWRLKSELRHFRALTMGKPIVMGRRTHESLGRPLDGRTNIVVSRNRDFVAPGIVVAPSIGDAMTISRADARRRGADAIMVIGGADIFAVTMGIADRLAITLVHLRPAGDVVFPPIDPAIWHESERSEQPAGPDDECGFAFLTFRCSAQAGAAADRARLAGRAVA